MYGELCIYVVVCGCNVSVSMDADHEMLERADKERKEIVARYDKVSLTKFRNPADKSKNLPNNYKRFCHLSAATIFVCMKSYLMCDSVVHL